MISPTWFDHCLIILLGVVLPAGTIVRGRPKNETITFDTAAKLNLYWSNSLLLWIMAAAVGFVWLKAGRSLMDLGLAMPRPSSFWWCVWFVVGSVALYILDTWLEVGSPRRRAQTRARWRRDTPFMPQTRRELAHYTVMALSAGSCEEIVFRGYFITYLLSLVSASVVGYWVAIFVPALVFGLSHLYQGWKAVSKIVVMSIAFGAMFLLTGSLWILIVLHFLVDLVGGFLGMWLLSSNDVAECFDASRMMKIADIETQSPQG